MTSLKPQIIEMPFHLEATQVAQVVAACPGAFFLDSADPSHAGSRYSYAGLSSRFLIKGNDNPWSVLEKIWIPQQISSTGAPFFSGGLVGYLAYESFRFLDPFDPHFKIASAGGGKRVSEGGGPPPRAEALSTVGVPEDGSCYSDRAGFEMGSGMIPTYWFALFDPVLVIDHRNNKTFLASFLSSGRELRREKEKWIDLFKSRGLLEKPRIGPFDGSTGSPCSTYESVRDTVSLSGTHWGHIPSYSAYEQNVRRIKKYLVAGDVYQVNLTERFEFLTDLDAANLYRRLRLLSPAPYSAFLNGGDFQILSASPESFFSIDGDRVTTRPIKGTRRRAPDPFQDEKVAAELLGSAKDRAELLMIVDLERNDLGKVSRFGSIVVDPLYSLESFSQVHHLVATVSGRLKEGVSPVETLRALFPGGSVTGAPKKRAMEIIAELELHPRSVYTGALGYFGLDGLTQFNMPIRTMVKVGRKIHFHAGGGIVIDSDPAAEYDEMGAKAAGMMKALMVDGERREQNENLDQRAIG